MEVEVKWKAEGQCGRYPFGTRARTLQNFGSKSTKLLVMTAHEAMDV